MNEAIVEAAFRNELQKIAFSRVPAPLLLGGIGGAIGLQRGARGILAAQRQDDDRLVSKLIDQETWRRRRDMRLLQAAGSAGAGIAVGGALPTLAGRLRNWIVASAQDAARPIGDQLEQSVRRSSDYVESRYSSALKDQADYAINRVRSELPASARKAGEEFGEGMGRALHDVTAGEGKQPVIILRHKAPWSRG